MELIFAQGENSPEAMKIIIKLSTGRLAAIFSPIVTRKVERQKIEVEYVNSKSIGRSASSVYSNFGFTRGSSIGGDCTESFNLRVMNLMAMLSLKKNNFRNLFRLICFIEGQV